MDADAAGTCKLLRRALLTEAEYALGPEVWEGWEDRVSADARSLRLPRSRTRVCATLSASRAWPSCGLEHVVCAAYMMHTVSWVQSFLSVPLSTALMLVSEITHGVPGDTVLPTLQGERVLHGVQINMMLIAQGMPIPYAERAAAAQQLEKLREHLRSYPRCNSEQVETLLHRVTEDAVDRLGGLDFYVGSNGLLLTASFLQVLASPRLNIVRHPKVWSAPKPGFFGPMWDEQHNPAMCTNDLTDYVGSVLPALLSFADGEMLSKSGKVSFSELKDEGAHAAVEHPRRCDG